MNAHMRVALILCAAVVAGWTLVAPADPPVQPTSAAPAAPVDPFVGDYAGKVTVTGVINKGVVAPRPKCGSCHATAAVRREPSGYVLDMTLQNSGQGKAVRVRLTTQPDGDRLVFRNSKYAVAVSAGLLTGQLTAQRVGTLEMVRGATSQPTSAPAGYTGR